MTAGEAFYELDGDRAIPSELTRGPWDAGSQHAGPPAALLVLGHAMETLPLGEEEMRIGRITYELLRPVPIAPLRIEAEIERGGRRVEYRFVEGSFVEPGPATVWMRSRVPLIAGEAISPLGRMLVVADSGNGVSATLDWRRFLFINVDLTVHLHRHPIGEWVCLDAVTLPQGDGIGLADTALWDEKGPIGRAAQTLLVAER